MRISKIVRNASASLALALMPVVAQSAEGTTIRVSLLDLSAVMGNRMSGQGMMGQGGNMGQGMPGQGMMGQGMMGQMMSIRIDKSTVKAGKVQFEVSNLSMAMEHEMLVVPLDNPDARLPYDPATARVPEDKIKSLGEVPELKPNASGTLELELKAGSYMLVCNVAGHYAAGMYTVLTVAK